MQVNIEHLGHPSTKYLHILTNTCIRGWQKKLQQPMHQASILLLPLCTSSFVCSFRVSGKQTKAHPECLSRKLLHPRRTYAEMLSATPGWPGGQRSWAVTNAHRAQGAGPKCDYPLPNTLSQPPARQYSHYHFLDKEVVLDLPLVFDSVFIHY